MGYSDIDITSNMSIQCLRTFMAVHEQYTQAAFQLGNDKGCSSNESHKLTKHVYVSVNKKEVKFSSGVYSVIGLNGKPNLSIFTYTKSPQELNEIIPNWAAVR